MGDRANVVIPQIGDKDISVYLYTHWHGTELPAMLQVALKRGQERWTHQSYLTRIIFSEMVRGARNLHMGEVLGFGISAYPTGNEHPFLIVDTKKQEVRIQPVRSIEADVADDVDPWLNDDPPFPTYVPDGDPVVYTFEEYVSLPNVEWPERTKQRELEIQTLSRMFSQANETGR